MKPGKYVLKGRNPGKMYLEIATDGELILRDDMSATRCSAWLLEDFDIEREWGTPEDLAAWERQQQYLGSVIDTAREGT